MERQREKGMEVEARENDGDRKKGMETEREKGIEIERKKEMEKGMEAG